MRARRRWSTGLAPNAVTLLRFPLAAAFPFVVASPLAALSVLVAAGVTDVLDGWLARRYGETTALGAALDGVADKVFALVVVGSVLHAGLLPLWAVAPLFAREVIEAGLLLWVAARGRVARERRAAPLGKAATLLQFLSIAAALVASPLLVPALLATGALGVAAGLAYWLFEARSTPAGGGERRR